MKTVALIDYGSGNLHSAARALNEAARLSGAAVKVLTTANPDDITAADRIVLPGVGHFADCAANLYGASGVVEALNHAVIDKGRPFFGICVGMQLLADFSLEDGESKGLGWVHGIVDRIQPGPGYRIPHMGWNEIDLPRAHPVLSGLGDEPHVYFTHSYAINPEDPGHIAATATYGEPLVAALARDNIIGTQFHPEKSQATGLKILSNFLNWNP